jgi:dinuclear metal center YbgI/SA1388 family protein
MQVNTLVKKLNDLLGVTNFTLEPDPSQNGLQVQSANDDCDYVALAVDASSETINKATAAGADLLIVHHGLFWGQPLLVTDLHYRRLHGLLSAGCGLYACHLPLDAHPVFGHNAQLAKLLGLTKLERFDVGWLGQLPRPLTRQDLLHQLALPEKHHYHFLEYGAEQIKQVALVSGGGGTADLIEKAAAAGADLYLTGELKHSGVISAAELSLNVLAVGHYWSETWGLKAVQAYLEEKWGLKTIFIESPTGF